MNENYIIPENIRLMKRPSHTILKKNSKTNRIYVYEYKKVKDENGKWKNVSGKVIGQMDPINGFMSNENSIILSSETCFDFGIYALIYYYCHDLIDKLNNFFNIDDAKRLFILSSIHYSEGYLPKEYIPESFKQSLFYILFKDLKMGEVAIKNIYESLGKSPDNSYKFENDLINESSHEIAIDGHSISSSSYYSDLTAKGNKVNIYKNGQLNVMMGYDINSLSPVFSKIYEGDAKDNKSIQDTLMILNFKNILFIIDKGFYSKENLKLFRNNNCEYIIPLQANTQNYKLLTSDFNLDYQINTFRYNKGREDKVIVYKEMKINDVKCYIFRDVVENSKECSDYLEKVNSNIDGYTMEKFNELRNTFGTLFIETSRNASPEEIFNLYKKRWTIETFYNTYKYQLDVNDLMHQSYYSLQGLSFIMLLSSIIDAKIRDVIRKNKSSSIKSVEELKRMLSYIKVQKINGRWQIMNLISKREIELKKLGFDLSYFNELLKNY